MQNKICCIFNIGPHYRSSIYELMDKELSCDFYFGDSIFAPIEIMNYHNLKGYKKTVKNLRTSENGWLWQTGVWKLIFKPYKHYIITGSPGSLSNWVLLLLAIPLGKKVYAWTHGMKGDLTPKREFLEKKFYLLCYRLLIYGDYSKHEMIKQGFKKEKLIPIYNSLDYEKQLKIRKKLVTTKVYQEHFKNNNPVIIYVGRIQKSKKLDLLINALKKLNDSDNPCNLIVVGKDIDDNNIPALVEQLQLQDNVWFYGPCYEEEKLGELFYNADVCVTPGLIGLTAIHALTYGVPVITSDNYSKHGPEFEAISPGVTGDFFKMNDLSDLCLKIKNWLNLSPNEKESLRVDAHKIIDEKYNPHNQVKILKQTITAV